MMWLRGFVASVGPQEALHLLSPPTAPDIRKGSQLHMHRGCTAGKRASEVQTLSEARAKQDAGCKVADLGSGGYCDHASERLKHPVDVPLANALLASGVLRGQSLTNFGGGFGSWNLYLAGQAELQSYKPIPPVPSHLVHLMPTSTSCYDGEHNVEVKSKGNCRWIDLTLDQRCTLPTVDWVLCLEVGEHVPKELEGNLFDTITQHADHGVLLSWAMPGQRGHNHVNTQPRGHIVAQMHKRGFIACDKLGASLRSQASFKWFKNTLQVFMRSEFASNSKLQHNITCE